ncbi:energy transducer TonB [Nitrincola iocasae]|uniref:Energy transducer TonB n=1 Tax=Nitrincola iocasae TaxID=2614693 RepID=A0A5J6LHA5_9GAMM|nr:energy transducer TonB [Nitrincola iocasae]
MIVTPDQRHSWYKTAADRFGLNLFLALALHGFLILAISFKLPETPPPQQTLDITLVQQASETPPEDADFFAQADQLGSGESDEKLLPSVTEESILEDEVVAEQAPMPQPLPIPDPQPEVAEPTPVTPEPAEPETATPEQTGAEQTPVVTQAPAPEQAPAQQQRQPASQPQPTAGQSGSLMARSMEIASIQAQLSAQQQTQARKPRVRRLTSSPSSMAHDDAIYLDNWRRRIETVGNMNYPEEARRNDINGSLRLLVGILPDGSVTDIEVLQSSGHAVLDNAAIRIVQMASPFQPFTNEMRRNTDRLEIIRTWKFEKRASVY